MVITFVDTIATLFSSNDPTAQGSFFHNCHRILNMPSTTRPFPWNSVNCDQVLTPDGFLWPFIGINSLG